MSDVVVIRTTNFQKGSLFPYFNLIIHGKSLK